MNIQELTTWQRLLNLELDASDTALPFSERLARENGWSARFADRAMEEYRKFCFLAVHAGHPVTPSEEVDQVWHLHMLYSRHYWDTLCRDTLETSLHHGPTQGGAAEGRKYHEWYEDTLASYRRYFGGPPEEVWPAARERFDPRNDFVRVNRRDVVTFDRALLRRGALGVLLGGGVLAMARAFAQGEPKTPSSAAGALLLLVMFVALVIALVRVAARGKRQAPRKRRRGHADAAVVGAGGSATGNHCPDGSGGHAGGGDCGGANGCGSSGCGGGGCGGGGCGGGS
ncbi:MAG TPA: hypothetical protein VE907_13725 [Gammaproteobacteria bacterium]|nr:hypothetical protein [Gammaproteobacteria bacterium]